MKLYRKGLLLLFLISVTAFIFNANQCFLAEIKQIVMDRDGDEIVTCKNKHPVHISHIKPWTEAMDKEFCPVCRVKYPKVLISKTYQRREITS